MCELLKAAKSSKLGNGSMKGNECPLWLTVRATSDMRTGSLKDGIILNYCQPECADSAYPHTFGLKCAFMCLHYLVQLYELGVGPRHLDGYLHYVLLLWHDGTSGLYCCSAAADVGGGGAGVRKKERREFAFAIKTNIHSIIILFSPITGLLGN